VVQQGEFAVGKRTFGVVDGGGVRGDGGEDGGGVVRV